jgi:hypothetical protein
MRQEIDRERQEREREIGLVKEQSERERKGREKEIRLIKAQSERERGKRECLAPNEKKGRAKCA